MRTLQERMNASKLLTDIIARHAVYTLMAIPGSADQVFNGQLLSYAVDPEGS